MYHVIVRRGWIIVLVTVLTLGIGCLAVVAVFWDDTPHFDFLKGHRPVPISEQAKARMKKYGELYTYYTFKDDFEQLRSRAEKELRDLGYRPVTSTRAPGFHLWEHTYFVKGDSPTATSPTTRSSFHSVSIIGGQRFYASNLDATMVGMAYNPGWITVIVGGRSSGPMTRLRSWLGL